MEEYKIKKLKKITKKMPYGDKIVKGLSKLISKYTPHNIAFGFSIGVFFGVLPTFGTAFFWSFLVAGLFRVSKLAAVLGSFVSNPFTAPFLYGFGFFIGSLIAGINFTPKMFLYSIKQLDLSLAFLKFSIGYFLVALLFALISYGIIYSIANYYYKKKEEKSLGFKH